jgi:lysophospholipase L1-like esterase
VRLDPLGVSVYAKQPTPPLAPGQRRVVFFGDSRAAMWVDPVGHSELQFINRGVGSQTTVQVLGRFDSDVTPLHPDVVVLELGVNDLKAIPLFPQLRESIVETCKANIARVVARAVAIHAHVVLTTVFPLGPVPLFRRPFWSDEVPKAIVEVNGFLETLASPDVTLFEADKVLLDGDSRIPAPFVRDLLHLSPAGYEALNGKGLVPLLSALPPKAAALP